MGELGEAISAFSIEPQGDLPSGRVLALLTPCCHQIFACESRRFKTIDDLSIGALEQLLQLLLFTAGASIKAKGLLNLGQFFGIDGSVIGFG